MKKYLALFLSSLILLFCCACGPQTEPVQDDTPQFRQLTISSEKVLEFKDEKGNILLNKYDVLCLREEYSDDYGFYLTLEFTPSGALKLANATKENIGKEISLFVNGEKVFSARVVAEITDGMLMVMHNSANYEELSQFADKIAG